MPSSITSRHAWCWGIFGAIFLACCLAAFSTSRDSDSEPILSVLWRERSHGLRLSEMSKAHCRDTFNSSWEGTIASIRPSFFPSSDMIGLDNCRVENMLKEHAKKIKFRMIKKITYWISISKNCWTYQTIKFHNEIKLWFSFPSPIFSSLKFCNFIEVCHFI